jgi:hypothetical protein
MVTVLGVPLIGTLFIPAVLGVITIYIIWSLSTRRKDGNCTGGLISAARGPTDPIDPTLDVNCVTSQPEKKVFGDRASSTPNLKSESDVRSAVQLKVQCAQNLRRKVFRSKAAADQRLQTEVESDLTKKNARKKHCKGKPGCCSKKNSARIILEGSIETVKVFFGTQAGKSKVKCNIAFRSSHIYFSYLCLTL